MKLLVQKSSILLLASFLTSIISLGQKTPQQTEALLKQDRQIREFSMDPVLKTPSFISLKNETAVTSAEAPVLLKKYFDQGVGHEFRNTKTDNLANGNVQVVRFREYYQGLPVEHSAHAVLVQDQKVVSIFSESYTLGTAFSVTPRVSEDEARQLALNFVNARKYAWDQIDEELAKPGNNPLRAAQLQQLREEYGPKAELVISKDLYGSGQARLAWKFNIYALEPLSRNLIYIDAQDGRILLINPIIKHASEIQEKSNGDPVRKPYETGIRKIQFEQPFTGQRITASELGTAHTRYAGIRNIYTTRLSVPLTGMNDPNNTAAPLQYSGVDPRIAVTGPIDVFILKDDTRGRGIFTYDMNGVGGIPLSIPALQAQSLAFVDKDNIWKNETTPGTNEDHIRGATSNGTIGGDEAANDDFALDAHWGAEMVYDYWRARHNRYSFDGMDGAIRSFVHYGPAYDNAFWDGSVMTYGDGTGSAALGFRPLTSLDVCGHEIGHGVCSYTSDLVYASESGAMNEGLSDIWAAAVENFVKTTIDPSLPYQVFQVGEQIAPDNIGLRRMDNPKFYGDPDTYGGVNWKNPVCTPTLANDQCGVHSNSGVINKWFTLVVNGPLTTTGSPAYTDDGRADLGAIANGGNNYGILGPAGPGNPLGTGEFLGIGFEAAENIAYLMELMLTPNATYAQARTASITAAKILYGDCSQAEKTVTDAWFAVNVGASYSGCTAPLLIVNTAFSSVSEFAVGGCTRYNDYLVRTNLTVAQGTAVTMNFSVTGGTLGTDEYQLLQNSVTYNPGETGIKTITLRIFDDAMVETDETLELTASSTSPSFSQVINFTIVENDIIPVVGATVTLLSQDFESTPTNNIPNNWARIDKITPSPVKWEVETYQSGVLSWSGKRAIIELTATSPATDGIAVYDQLASAQTILRTPLINTAGLSNIRVQFVFSAGGEPACAPACDYGQLMYSYDGVVFSPFSDSAIVMYSQLTDYNFDYTLPGYLNGKSFYLAIVWNNDSNAGLTASITIDNFIVTGKGKAIENTLNSSVIEKVNAETGKPNYFYSIEDGELITRVSNSTAHNFRCTSMEIERAGNGSFTWYSDGSNLHRVADKLVKSIPTTENTSANYNISLYFTEAQILALESILGMPRSTFRIYHTTAANYTLANGTNTISVNSSYSALAGVGGVFSANLSGGLGGSFAIGRPIPQIPLPVNCNSFTAQRTGTGVSLQWKVSDERNNEGFEILRSVDGIQFQVLSMINANANNAGVYQYQDNATAGLNTVYYRIRQIDMDGSSKFICTVLKVNLGNTALELGKIYPNPGERDAYINVFTEKPFRISIEYVNSLGQQVSRQVEQVMPGASRLNLETRKLLSGTYMVRFRDEEGNILSSQVYIRN